MEHPGLFIGLIPDGNRRAVDNEATRFDEAYRKGAEAVSAMLKSVVQDSRVHIFTAWGLSDDNVKKRTAFELDILNGLFCDYLEQLDRDVQTPAYGNVRVLHIGDDELLKEDVLERLQTVVDRTRDRQEKIFGICLAHGGAEEIERASDRKLAHWHLHREQLPLQSFLDLPFRGKIPFKALDMIVRTGTEHRAYTSAYLTGYQTGGTEEFFLPQMLPDCTPEDLAQAIAAYEKIHKRLGQ